MSWHSEFKSFTVKLVPLYLRGREHKIPDSKNEAQQFPCASSLSDFEKMTGLFFKNLSIHLSRKVYTFVSNLQGKLQHICLISHTSFILQIFQITLVIKSH